MADIRIVPSMSCDPEVLRDESVERPVVEKQEAEGTPTLEIFGGCHEHMSYDAMK